MNDPAKPTVAQYPFANTHDPVVREAIDGMIRGVHKLVVKLVNQHFTNATERDDAVVAVESHLALYTARMFDPSRAKWSTLVHRAATNHCLTLLKQRKRRKKQRHEDVRAHDIAGDSRQYDRRIELLARAILKQPRQFGLSTTQTKVFRAMTNAGPGVQLKDVAASLGYSHPSSMSIVFKRIKNVIRNISIEDFELIQDCDGQAMLIPKSNLSDTENAGQAA